MEWRNERTCDVLNLILGAFLLISPWVVGFESGLQTQNAVICGLIIAVLSIAALSAFFERRSTSSSASWWRSLPPSSCG